MKKSILFFWVLFVPVVLFSQTISNVQISLKGSGIWYSPPANTVNIDPYELPTTVLTIQAFTYTFDYTAPATYPPYVDRVIYPLMLRKTSAANPNGTQQLIGTAFVTPTASGTYTATFTGLAIPVDNNVTYSFTLLPRLDGPFGPQAYLPETPQYKFIRSNTPSRITGNTICCGADVAMYPYTPPLLTQTSGFVLVSSDGSPMSYQWQINDNGNWSNIPFATSATYQPIAIIKNTEYRRKVTSALGTVNFSDPISFSVPLCQTDQNLLVNEKNTICGRQSFYNLVDGQIVFLQDILGSFVQPDITTREFGFSYEVSENGGPWVVVKDKTEIDLYSDSWMSQLIVNNPVHFLTRNIPINGSTRHALLDYSPPPFTFNIQKGAVQTLRIRRKYYHKYDPWNCCSDFIIDVCGMPCGIKWIEWNISNTVVLTFTTGELKPVPDMIAPVTQATCNPNEQLTFSIPRVNNNETFRWEIPAHFSTTSVMQGPNATSITVLTNAANQNYVQSGNVCVTVSQTGSDVRKCVTVKGTVPFNVSLPASQSGCEGQNVVLKPVVTEGFSSVPVTSGYTYTWRANQSPVVTCANPAGPSITGCRELNVNVQFADKNPDQLIELSAKSIYGCEARATSKVTAIGGWQTGILNSYSDPQAIANSNLAIDVPSNYLYFTNVQGLYRSYYDYTAKIWKYVALKDAVSQKPIEGSGTLLFDKTTTSKLYYTSGTDLYYAESTDDGITWLDKKTTPLITNIGKHICIYNGNLYYMNGTSRLIYYKPLNNLAAGPVLVGPVMLGGSNTFIVQDGILAYGDAYNSSLVLYNALTGAPVPVNIPAANKVMTYGSNVCMYGGNVYFIVNETIRIVKKDITGSFSSYIDVPGTNKVGKTFTINSNTGTIYAATVSAQTQSGPVQLYYLGGTWNTNFIRQYNTALNAAVGITNNQMISANGHVFFLTGGYLANTFYIDPCVPSIQRAEMEHGDQLNDPLPNTVPQVHLLQLVPNPAAEQTRVNFILQKGGNTSLRIISVTGSTEVVQTAYAETGTHEWDLNLSDYAPGVYMVQILVDGHLYGQAKLVKNQ